MESFDLLKPTVFVIAGAGSKGLLGFLGPLYTLETLDWLSEVHSIAGTSIGAFFAVALILGFDVKSIMEIMWSLNLADYMSSVSISTFFQKGFVVDTSFIDAILEPLIYAKTGKKDLSFQELYEFDPRKRKFYCNAVSRDVKSEHHVYSVVSSPNMSVTKAIKMSSALPMVFQLPQHDGVGYCDGGLINNFLVDIFDDKKERILGLRFRKVIPSICVETSVAREDDTFVDILWSLGNPISSSYSLTKYLMWIFLCQNKELERLRYKNLTFDCIEIDPQELTTFSVFVSRQQKVDMFYHGVFQTVIYLRKKCNGK